MAIIKVDYGELTGGIPSITFNLTDGTTYSSLHTESIEESDYILVSLQGYSTPYVLKRGESQTLTVSGSYGTTVTITFASDGKSISWTKSSGYQYLSIFAIKI